jgi:prophage maintenance system killer protein
MEMTFEQKMQFIDLMHRIGFQKEMAFLALNSIEIGMSQDIGQAVCNLLPLNVKKDEVSYG